MTLLVSEGNWFRKGGLTMSELKLTPEILGEVDQYMMFNDIPSPMGMNLTPSNRLAIREDVYPKERGEIKNVFSFSDIDISHSAEMHEEQSPAIQTKATQKKQKEAVKDPPAKQKTRAKSRKRSSTPGDKKPKETAKKRKKTTASRSRRKITVGPDARATRLARNVYEKERVHKLNEELSKLRQNLLAHGVLQGKMDKKSVISGALSELRRLQKENASLRSKIEGGAGAL